MKLILLGAPGSGKGTQGARLSEKYGIPAISTGDILRDNIRRGTVLGTKAKASMDQGKLVPDDVVIGLIANRIQEKDCGRGFMLDGFPRTVAQADALAALADIDKVVNISVPLNKLTARLTGRRVCGDCGLSYHVSTYEQDRCACGGCLITRPDDNDAAVKVRLDAYIKNTAPLIAYYKAAGKLADIDGDRAIDAVFSDIVSALT
ncbi:MAG: adenylate kinase [Firmicutes bacterium]|nr:adenylate kinase [Bacillota bacterium]